MCKFISAKKKGDQYFYLTKSDLKGKRFKDFKKENPIWRGDICGHGAIDYLYPGMEGEHWECSNFSSPNNFPPCIVEDIKKGNFKGIGICPDILNESGRDEYEKIRGTALEEHDKIRDPAWAEYEKIRGTALEEYDKIEGPAWAEYKKIRGTALEEYDKIRDRAWAEYKKIRDRAWAEYLKKCDCIFWKIAMQKRYRKTEWK